MGLYTLLAIVFLFLAQRVIARGPVAEAAPEFSSGAPMTTV
jgi:cytochrome bd-type quinol oxidase subunit 1